MSEARIISPRVTMIPATRERFTSMPIHNARKRRVAAYARVSTRDEEQRNSYEAQVDHYTRYIQNNAEWEFAGVYADRGITGTSTKKREHFNDMIEDALNGKIDLIITKSVSRFARNTVDSLTTIRTLKERGIEVFFEEQNIYTLDSKGELLLTIMSSLAQEESRNISENVTWGIRKRFSDGKIMLPYKHFLGYRKGENNLPEIVPEEAETVKRIYRAYLEGKSPSYIARQLSASGIPSPSGKANWRPETVKSILTNEKYKGDAVLQKTFCTDFLTKKFKANEGEVPQYYVENSHPAIIEPEVFDMVQAEIRRREQSGRRYYTPHCFSGRIFCDECGSVYGSKVWHRHTVWQCNSRSKGLTPCQTPALRAETLQDAFVTAFNRIIENKEEIISICEKVLSERYDADALAKRRAELETEMEIVTELMQRQIALNATQALDQEAYQRQYDEYEARYNAARQALTEINAQQSALAARQGKIAEYISLLREQGLITEFNERLWYATVDQVRVLADGRLRFIFRDGTRIEG